MANFNEIIKSDTPVLIDFYAEWCAPCRMIPPILKQVKDSMGEQLKIIKIDVDKNPHVAAAYNIQSVPTIMLFKNGKQVWRNSGVSQANQLISIVQSNI